MNMQLEKSVMASLDYANLAEYVSFGTADFNKIVDGLKRRQEVVVISACFRPLSGRNHAEIASYFGGKRRAPSRRMTSPLR